MNKRYENKSAYDPGRFRYAVEFYEESVSIADDGSQIPAFSLFVSTKAVREAVTRRFNLLGDMSVEAGQNIMNSYWYFIIRYRPGFVPKKDMLIYTVIEGGVYTINAAPELDEPRHYWRLLCVKTDRIITL